MGKTLEASRDGTESDRGSTIRAQLAIKPHPESSCVVSDTGQTRDVTQQIKATDTTVEHRDSEYSECHTELSTGDGDRAYLTSSVHAKCICPVLADHECIPEIEGVRSETLVVSLVVPQQEELRKILTDLQAVGATVSVEWIVRDDPSDTVVELDVSSITDKQCEAVEAALAMGYYETPRETDLAGLAEHLDISKSAVSQRLNAAETKLIKAFTAAETLGK